MIVNKYSTQFFSVNNTGSLLERQNEINLNSRMTRQIIDYILPSTDVVDRMDWTIQNMVDVALKCISSDYYEQ